MSFDQPAAGRFEGRVHLLPIRIYYEDTDFTGVVYHANYLRYFERGRSDFLRLAGVDHTLLLEGDGPTTFAVVRLAIDYLKPARVDDALVVRTAYETVAGPRIESQELWRGGELLARAAVQACCISLTGRAKKPPPLLVERLKPFLT